MMESWKSQKRWVVVILLSEVETLELGGRAAWSMQLKETHWFRLNESPTNITFFPLHVSKNSKPSNLIQNSINQSDVINHPSVRP